MPKGVPQQPGLDFVVSFSVTQLTSRSLSKSPKSQKTAAAGSLVNRSLVNRPTGPLSELTPRSLANKPKKLIAVVAALSLVAISGTAVAGSAIAGAATATPKITTQTENDIIYVTGTAFPKSATINAIAEITNGSGNGTVNSTSDGKFKLGFQLPPSFEGNVTITATSSDAKATTSLMAKSSAALPASAAQPQSTGQSSPNQSVPNQPATTQPTNKSSTPVAKITYGPLLPANVLSPQNELRSNISTAPLASNSSAVAANVAKQVANNWGGVAAFNYNQYNATTFTVAPNTKRINIEFNNCQKLNYTPTWLWNPAQGAMFSNVPVPENALVSKGTDKEISIYDPATDQLWEFWVMEKTATGWSACWGGRLDHASKTSTFPDHYGATATGLPTAFTAVGIREMQAGSINHAIGISVIDAESAEMFSFPAHRSDGYNPNHEPNRIVEGQRMRLDPSINVDSLHLHPIAAQIAKAAQTYGFIIEDKGGAVAINVEDGNYLKATTGVNPWDKMLNGTAGHRIMAGFPWDKMQVIQKDYGKSAS